MRPIVSKQQDNPSPTTERPDGRPDGEPEERSGRIGNCAINLGGTLHIVQAGCL